MGKHKTKSDHSMNDTPEHAGETERAVETTGDAAELLRALEIERDEAVAARQRALADFVNFQRRAGENERRALHSGAAGIVRSIIPVLDHFDLALCQKSDQLTVDQLIGGVKIVRDELAKALQVSGVERIEPRPNDEFDPNRHEAMMRQPAEGIAPDHIVSVLQPGYMMGDMVLRPAKVAIAPAPANESEGSEAVGEE